MSDSSTPTQIGSSSLRLPEFGKIPAVSFEMANIREAERRLIEAKMVSPITYAELEHCYNEAYRDLKKHLSAIGYHLALIDKAMEQAKAVVLLDKYPEYLRSHDMKKSQDNADLRKAFLMQDADYLLALDRFNQLKALESSMDGKIKVMENVCRYMRKQMDITLRSGMDPNLYGSRR